MSNERFSKAYEFERDAMEAYDEFLDEIHEAVTIGDCSYDVSRVLKEVDPIAYEQGLYDFVDMQDGGFCDECGEGQEEHTDDCSLNPDNEI